MNLKTFLLSKGRRCDSEDSQIKILYKADLDTRQDALEVHRVLLERGNYELLRYALDYEPFFHQLIGHPDYAFYKVLMDRTLDDYLSRHSGQPLSLKTELLGLAYLVYGLKDSEILLDHLVGQAQYDALANYLCWAAKYGYMDLVDSIFTRDVNDHIATMNNNKAFIAACANGHISIVRRFLMIEDVRALAGVVDNAALKLSSGYGHHDIVKLLMDQPVVRQGFEQAPFYVLQQTCAMGQVENFKYLLSQHDCSSAVASNNNHLLLISAQRANTGLSALDYLSILNILIQFRAVRGGILSERTDYHHPVQRALALGTNQRILNALHYDIALNLLDRPGFTMTSPNQLSQQMRSFLEDTHYMPGYYDIKTILSTIADDLAPSTGPALVGFWTMYNVHDAKARAVCSCQFSSYSSGLK